MKKLVALSCFILMFSPIIASAEVIEKADDTVKTSDTLQQNDVTETQSSTTESTTETSSTADSASEQPAEEEQDAVIAAVEAQIGTTAITAAQAPDLSSASGIRAALISEPDYGITEQELKSYSDAQLMDAMTLFERYNQDIYGMDLGAYVGLLRALFEDQTLSWAAISQQLSFNPNSFARISDLVNHVDALQNYLAALYPTNSSFYAASRIVSNEELAAILNYLQPMEDKLIQRDGQLFPGRMAFILQTIDDGIPLTNVNLADKTKTSDSEKTAVSESTAASEKKTAEKDLPKTNEKSQGYLSLVGIILLGIGAEVILLRKRLFKK